MIRTRHSADINKPFTLLEDRHEACTMMYHVIGLLLVLNVINTYASIVNEIDLKLIDLYKKQYGEHSIVKVYHRNKKHYATKEPLVHYEILVVAEAFYGVPMADRMLAVREMAINNVPSIPGTLTVFTCYVPTFEEWRIENNKEQQFEVGEVDRLQANGK
ncbi:uncharacterized protein LOC103514791 [Diaphorina citri]|uniref:Uncharacterized protein LOC103514791 n=1 Tax=Diaphorina citri TaxID=121845 RepID=A0A1S3DAP2_DIACI|nr:uncharacterized protein LOC103514791 [Diaphorina citri]XP_008477925.1 uncharacterized protein LOC103514791 [Diaphorina citri]